jgi:hypothetical protein
MLPLAWAFSQRRVLLRVPRDGLVIASGAGQRESQAGAAAVLMEVLAGH